jgi:hypothetical protein
MVYVSLTLAVFAFPVTVTAAGIAAFVLSVGMAVDANVLIFERMKEELRIGRSLVGAIDAGFSRAWTSIRDSNRATLITCFILYWFGDHFCRLEREGICDDAVPRRGSEHVLGDHRHAHVPADADRDQRDAASVALRPRRRRGAGATWPGGRTGDLTHGRCWP